MANEEQLSILKQGVEVWNKWRKENRHVQMDGMIDLSRSDLHRMFLRKAAFYLADLTDVDLSDADLTSANLWGANLSEAKFNRANLYHANLNQAKLISANLTSANLVRADLTSANLISANLSKTALDEANLSEAKLTGANFLTAIAGSTIFGNSNLSEVIGLEEVNHRAPSIISTSTFALSKGKIPEIFLRGCGLSDWEIEMVKLYNPNLSNEERNKVLYKVYDLQASQAIQISPLFVSYSHADSEFVNRISAALTEKGIRYWRDIHEMRAGRIEPQIDRGIRQNPTVLLILSEHSLSSDWVEHEVRTARALEKDLGRDVLCPVALDDSWKDSRWPKRVIEQIMEYNILDFSDWKDDSKFEGMFRKLIDGLELFYKG